jgi:hypothetical protein
MTDDTKTTIWLLAVAASLLSGMVLGQATARLHFQPKLETVERERDSAKDAAEIWEGTVQLLGDRYDDCRDQVIKESRDVYSCAHDIQVCQKLLREGWACGPLKGLRDVDPKKAR